MTENYSGCALAMDQSGIGSDDEPRRWILEPKQDATVVRSSTAAMKEHESDVRRFTAWLYSNMRTSVTRLIPTRPFFKSQLEAERIQRMLAIIK